MNGQTLETLARLVPVAAPLGLVLSRCLGLCWTAPALGSPALGPRMRLAFAGALAVLLLPVVAADLPRIWSPLGLAAACGVELAVGAILGWSAGLVIVGARQAGEVVGIQAGLSPAALLDPEAAAEMTATGHLYGLVALAVFLTLDGPLELTRALAESFRAIPAGGTVVSAEVATRLCGRVGWALALALRAAAPAGVALAVAGLALGLLGRAAASLSPLTLALPIRLLLGLVLVLVGLAGLAATLAGAWRGVFPGSVGSRWLGF